MGALPYENMAKISKSKDVGDLNDCLLSGNLLVFSAPQSVDCSDFNSADPFTVEIITNLSKYICQSRIIDAKRWRTF